MKVNIHDIGGQLVKLTDTYELKDNTELNSLVLSSTLLNEFKETRGHKHKGQEEVYYFVHGSGEMVLGWDKFDVEGGDVVLIPDGVYHKVINNNDKPLYFVCVFDGRRKELDYNN